MKRVFRSLLVLVAIAAVSPVVVRQVADGGHANAPKPAPAAMTSRAAKVPLGFEANQGQADPSVRFLSRTGGYPVSLTPGAAVLGTPDGEVTLRVVGARAGAPVEGVERLPGVLNDLRGDDPAQWHRGIPMFGSVAYRGVLPGVDLVYHGAAADSVEYDFVVGPGADPSAIAVEVGGTQGLSIDSHGDLLVHTASGVVRQHKPVVFQEVDGRREPVPGGFELRAGGEVGFHVGAYDKGRPLVIDPTISFSFQIPGAGLTAAAVAVDTTGHAYVSGTITAAGLPGTFGTYRGAKDAFVAKLNDSGTGLDYAAILGGTGDDKAAAIAVDAVGQAYIAGSTASTNFPTTPNAYEPASPCSVCESKAFVTVLDATGSSMPYSTYFGRIGQQLRGSATGVAVDPSGKVYVIGDSVYGDAIPTTPGALGPYCVRRCRSFIAGFAAKFDPAGAGSGSLVYSTLLSSEVPNPPANEQTSGTSLRAVAVDAAGNAYITGQAGSSFPPSIGFPTTPGTFDSSNTPKYTAIVTKLNSTGTKLVYGARLGHNTMGSGTGIAIDSAGNAYVTGIANEGGFPIAGNPARSQRGPGFFSKINPDATVLTYSTYTDGAGAGIALDSGGAAFVTGAAPSSGFTAVDPIGGQSGGAFLTKYDTNGQYKFSSLLNGADGIGVAVDPSGAAYVAESNGSVLKVSGAPVVSGLDPTGGPSAGGTAVTITGSGFSGATAVTFGSDSPLACGPSGPCQPDAQSPDTVLHVTTPAHAPGSAPVSVAATGGTSAATGPLFTWRPPVVSQVSGATEGPATGDSAVTLSGSDLQGAAVDFGGAAASSVTVNTEGTSVTAMTPARDTAGAVAIGLTIPASGAVAAVDGQFTYHPALTGILTPTGRLEGGDKRLIVGEGFNGATGAVFGTDAPQEFFVISHSQIAVKTPPHDAGQVEVKVTAAGLDSMAVPDGADMFTYAAAVITPLPEPGAGSGVPAPGSNASLTPGTPGGGGGGGSPGLAAAPLPPPTPGATPAPFGAATPSAVPIPVSGGTAQLAPGNIQVPSGSALLSPSGAPPAPGSAPTPGAVPAPPAVAPSAAPAPGTSGANAGAAGGDSSKGSESAPRYTMNRSDTASTVGVALGGAAVLAGFGCVLVADRRSRYRTKPRPARAGVPTGARRG